MKLKVKQTSRGFDIMEFSDSYGVECSLQVSSSVEPHIWLGAKEIGLKKLKLGATSGGWEDIDTSGDEHTSYIANTRMHLSQEEVKALLPTLIKFANSGEII